MLQAGMSAPILTLDETKNFLDREFPQMQAGGRAFHLEAVGPLSARMRMEGQERFLRPGGTVSGPAMMARSSTSTRPRSAKAFHVLPVPGSTSRCWRAACFASIS